MEPSDTESESQPVTEPPAPNSRRILLGGCAAILLVVGLFVAAAWMILSAVQGGAGDGEFAEAPYVAPGERAMEDRGILTRSEARALRADLLKIERELDSARDQREVSFDPATRESWSIRIAELEEQREAILERLRR